VLQLPGGEFAGSGDIVDWAKSNAPSPGA